MVELAAKMKKKPDADRWCSIVIAPALMSLAETIG
jgi:hypothetical protein